MTINRQRNYKPDQISEPDESPYNVMKLLYGTSAHYCGHLRIDIAYLVLYFRSQTLLVSCCCFQWCSQDFTTGGGGAKRRMEGE